MKMREFNEVRRYGSEVSSRPLSLNPEYIVAVQPTNNPAGTRVLLASGQEVYVTDDYPTVRRRLLGPK